MSGMNKPLHEVWSNRWTFILASTGSAVGLGNIWKFPYITGENGGGAFVLFYLICILIIGIPVMMAEVLMGRRARRSPVRTLEVLASEAGASKNWHIIGWMGVAAGIIILSYYSVIAGWALLYIPKMLLGSFQGVDGSGADAMFSGLLSDKEALTRGHTFFMLMTVGVVLAGVSKGVGRAAQIMMPALLVLMLILLVFSYFQGAFSEAAGYLFSFDLSGLTMESALIAMGHAFFTLSLGMGAIMVYGAYMPSHTTVARSVLVIALMDTAIALLAGMVIFPIVFANPVISPGEGPGLLFISLPIAFGNMPAGLLFGTLFFVLITIAAWTSAISLIEPGVAWLTEGKSFNRFGACLLLGVLCWLLGLGTVLSFNDWSSLKLFDRTFFDWADVLTSSIMLPLGGMLIALFVGHAMSKAIVRDEMDIESSTLFNVWHWTIRWLAPIAVGLVFVFGLYNTFF